jgi:hypothetical protein
MSRAVITSDPERRGAFEPLYEKDPATGASIEVLYADRALAKYFAAPAGWFWWACLPGRLPDTPPHGPFATSYGAFRDALARGGNSRPFGKRQARGAGARADLTSAAQQRRP